MSGRLRKVIGPSTEVAIMETCKYECDLVFLKNGHLVMPVVEVEVDEFTGMVLSYEVICKEICKLDVTPDRPSAI
jgi:hypothetical protein